MTTDTKKKVGFATWDPKKLAETSRLGGKAAHVHGRAHQFTSDEARIAGRKGGLATAGKKREPREPKA